MSGWRALEDGNYVGMRMLAPTVANARSELIAGAGRVGSVRELFGTISERLRRLVQFDAAAWVAKDRDRRAHRAHDDALAWLEEVPPDAAEEQCSAPACRWLWRAP